jgi:hypothetical protein
MSLLPPEEDNDGEDARTVDEERLIAGEDEEGGSIGLGTAFGAPD